MRAPILVLKLTAFAFLAFGLVGLAYPELVVGPAGVLLTVPSARAEIRAFYGGLELGFGLFLWAGALRPDLRIAATLAATCSLFGLVLARTFGLMAEQFVNGLHVGMGTLELVGAALNLWAYTRLSRGLKSRREVSERNAA